MQIDGKHRALYSTVKLVVKIDLSISKAVATQTLTTKPGFTALAFWKKPDGRQRRACDEVIEQNVELCEEEIVAL